MMPIKDIYAGAENLINQFLKKESFSQGHFLTGKLEESLRATFSRAGKADVLEGFAVYYAQYVDQGVPPESASFKQVPFLIEYFKKRGYGEKEATAFAFATVKKWMKEGMSTQASKRFSSTGSRQNFIENSFVGNDARLNDYMENTFDFAVEEQFQKEKSETI